MGIRRITIAGINILYEFPEEFSYNLTGDFANNFEVTEDIRIKATVHSFIPHMIGDAFFEKELSWYTTESGYVIDRIDSERKDIQIRVLVDKEWTSAEIQVRKGYIEAEKEVESLFLEILFRNAIFSHLGVVIHGSAIYVDGKAILFSAPSGTGKSTQAGLWVLYKGAVHINDDHPAVVIREGKVLAYGTPWAGSDCKYSNICAPLKAIIILQQAKDNRIERLNSHQIIKDFLPRCLLPYYDKAQMDKVMKVFKTITGSVPVFKLFCKPDKGAVELLEGTLSKELKE